MVISANEISLRKASSTDRAFILSLSPILAKSAKLSWHNDFVVQKFQDDYICEALDKLQGAHLTLIAEKNGVSLGFINMCEVEDGHSGESCGSVPLLAVSPQAQGMGVGQILMLAAENWAKEQGYRLLHLEVFSNNDGARRFYQKSGFEEETLVMIKTLS